MVLQITLLLLLVSIFLLIDGDQNQKDKEILALKINIAKLDSYSIKWMENATQFQNRKTALLNEKLEQALEEHDLEIDTLQNASTVAVKNNNLKNYKMK